MARVAQCEAESGCLHLLGQTRQALLPGHRGIADLVVPGKATCFRGSVRGHPVSRLQQASLPHIGRERQAKELLEGRLKAFLEIISHLKSLRSSLRESLEFHHRQINLLNLNLTIHLDLMRRSGRKPRMRERESATRL